MKERTKSSHSLVRNTPTINIICSCHQQLTFQLNVDEFSMYFQIYLEAHAYNVCNITKKSVRICMNWLQKFIALCIRKIANLNYVTQYKENQNTLLQLHLNRSGKKG
jgi:hypothetical protein